MSESGEMDGRLDMNSDTDPERFGTSSGENEVEAAETVEEQTADEEDRLQVELNGVREALDRVSRERDIYRQLSTVAESNELNLHRRLSGYVDAELEALRAEVRALRARSEEIQGGER